jgi:hypothetical protein
MGHMPDTVLALFQVSSMVVCGVVLLVWWKLGDRQAYREILLQREKSELFDEILQKEKRIEEVETDNTALSRIIHSDNKMIPALERALRALCDDYTEENADALINELNRVRSTRKGVLNEYKRDYKPLPRTNIPSLDITLDYIKQRAYDNGIEFDVLITGDVKPIVEAFMTEEQLRTISADLLENAIIAVRDCTFRHIVFSIGFFDGCYEIRIEDSGIAFQKETLRQLGTKRTTTHKHEGGSGIGMMEAFDIANKTNAQLIITPLTDSERGFTKCISLKFDGGVLVSAR